MYKYARKRIKEHRATFEPDNIRDFVDLYLKAEEHEYEEAVNEENMFRVIVDLFNAGTDTTSTTLAWAIFYLMTNPDVQDKCQKEIIENIGSVRAVSLNDKEHLHYLDATIKETLRLACLVPLVTPHTVLEDTRFEGYTIPKESTILFHLNAVLTDPNIWVTPEEFNPERFLTEEGKKKEKEFFIPFSTGIAFGNGEIHQKLRKFTLVTLKDFGVGKKSLEERIQDEACILADELESYGGQPRDIRKTLQRAVANIIAGIIYGSRLDYDDPDFLRLILNVDTIFAIQSGNLPENVLPFLAYLPNSKGRKILNAYDDMSRYARRRIKEHRETFDPSNIRDFVDFYLKAEEHEDEEVVNEENMFRVIVDLFNAGTDTTATTLVWAILYLMTNPDVQDKCQKEIIENIGSGRAVSLRDKDRLQYLDATIKETLRLASIVPLGVPHTVQEDTQFEGYTIPKESIIIFHLNSVLTDPNIWEKPEEFHPERFLTEEGKQKEKEFFIPFSIGSRSCLGKHLAMMELFLFLGNLLQRFTFKIPPGCPTPSVERVHTGITCQPHPYQVCVVPN